MSKKKITPKASKADKTRVRKMLNSILQKNKNLVLNETKKGGFQIRRDGDVIIAGLSIGVKVTHPVETANSHPATQAKHMTIVPYDEVTPKILAARVKDKRRSSEIEASVYKKDGGVAPCHAYREASSAKKKTATKAKASKKGKQALKKTSKAAKKVKRTPADLKKRVAKAKA